jgi:hypothetical protein
MGNETAICGSAVHSYRSKTDFVMKKAAVRAAAGRDPTPTIIPANNPRRVGRRRAALQLPSKILCEINAAMVGPKVPIEN